MHELAPLFMGGVGLLVLVGLHRVLRGLYSIILLFLSIYLLSLFVLAKLGFIDIHVDKFEALYRQINDWFVSFWNWIVNYVNGKQV
jgi:uncharacterized membrane protein (Fun14 family)